MPERITVISLLPEHETAALAARRPDITFTGVEAADRPATADVLLVETPPSGIESYLTEGIRWVHTLATGVEGFPLDALRGVSFTCSRGDAGAAIAEWVLAVMLAFEKQLPESFVADAERPWFRAGLGGLKGATLGVVGMGGIGTAIARRALAFDMRVVGLRRRVGLDRLPGTEVVTRLSELLPVVDHLVLAAPATPTTTNMLDEHAFAQLKPGAHLVNIARGSLVNQDALRAALDDGRVARASLDVATPEPLPAGHWLYSHPGVRLSPHISWSAPWQRQRVLDTFLDNLARFVDGRPLANHVDIDAGY